jgi:hypothetical protein
MHAGQDANGGRKLVNVGGKYKPFDRPRAVLVPLL